MKILLLEEIPQAKDVPLDDPMAVYKTLREMEIVCAKASGLGLSAVQVGVPWKAFIIDTGGLKATPRDPDVKLRKTYRHFVNCDYAPVGDQKESMLEGCLSLPRRRFLVPRWSAVRVEGYELVIVDRVPTFTPYAATMHSYPTGACGTVFQHEIDHHNGITIDQVGREMAGFY